jgi:hypothetical protein
VDPLMGFSIALFMIAKVISVKNDQMLTNLHQKFLIDKHNGMIHIPINVQVYDKKKSKNNARTIEKIYEYFTW